MGRRGERADPSGVPVRGDYGAGTYRRRIRVVARDGSVSGELEDDFHHFRATLEHDGQRITRARGEALRVPWTTCPGAVRPIEQLAGMELTASLRTCAKHTNPRAQCTHLFDAASLAVAFAAAGARDGARTYDIAVPDRVDGRTRAALEIDGAPCLAFDIAGNEITGPPPFDGQALSGGGFGRWADATLTAEGALNAQVLQKAVFIAGGRKYQFDGIARAAIFGEAVGGACHTFSPTYEDTALRVQGSVRDYSATPDALLEEPPDPIDPLSLEPHGLPPRRLLFVCVENSNRSQMAEAFARVHGGENVEAYSAGSRPAGRVHPKAVAAMREHGYDLSTHASTAVADLPDVDFTAVATMGCGDACPTVRAVHRRDWTIADPRDLDEDAFREVRDAIEQHVVALLAEIEER